MGVLRFLPLSYISWLLGTLANIPLPQPFARWTVGVFARAYRIDVSTATKSLAEFRCIGEFFTRDLKPEVRPRGEGLLSPVDGTLRGCHELSPGSTIPQVKGKDYTLEQLLAGDPFAARLKDGVLWNMYLSPSDAHHIFSPVSGRIVKTLHIPGKLWPVNDWALNSVEGLFAVNERVVTFLESERGLVAVVMIGATNVGRIALRYMPLETNLRPWLPKVVRRFEHTDLVVQAGEKLATFKMGSSVIVVTEKRYPEASVGEYPRKVQYGVTLHD
jgi:phosphatidylserine decarboxylase